MFEMLIKADFNTNYIYKKKQYMRDKYKSIKEILRLQNFAFLARH